MEILIHKSYFYFVGFLTTLKNKFIDFAHPFDASKSRTASEKCRKDTKAFLKGLENLDLWALRSEYYPLFIRQQFKKFIF